MEKCIDPEKGRLFWAQKDLEAVDRAELEAHLELCPACRRRLGFERILSSLTEDPEEVVPSTHPSPDALLAYHEAGDEPLDPEELSALEEHLTRCPQCSKLVDLLKNLTMDHEETAGVADLDDLSSSAGERAARLKPLFFPQESTLERSPAPRTMQKIFLAPLAAAAMVILLLTGLYLSNYAAPPSWFLRAEMEEVSETRSPLKPGLQPNDLVRLSCRVSHACWIYVYSIDPQEGLVPVAPETADLSPFRGEKGKDLYIPGDNHFVVEGKPGEDVVLLVAAFNEPLDKNTFPSVLDLLKRQRNQAPLNEKDLGRALGSIPHVGRASVKILKAVIQE